MMDHPVRLVKELKGAPLSIWTALIFAGQRPVDQAWLARNTGYTDKPIKQALAYLAEHGFVTRAGSGWIITAQTRQLLLHPVPEDNHPEPIHPDPPDSNSDQDGPDRNNSDSPISIIRKGFKNPDDSMNTNSGDRKKSDNLQPTANGWRFSDFPDLSQALVDLGIMENARTRHLLGCITPRDVRVMAAKIRDDPFHDLSETGLMVTMLEATAQRNERRSGYESWNDGS